MIERCIPALLFRFFSLQILCSVQANGVGAWRSGEAHRSLLGRQIRAPGDHRPGLFSKHCRGGNWSRGGGLGWFGVAQTHRDVTG